MNCPACGSENESGRKFCGECGGLLAQVCSSCGTPNGATVKFCGECGARLLSGTAPGGPDTSPTRSPSAPASERRLVSVLFADLVGFTALSEALDPEEVRDLLSSYFETARQLISRYGGTIEKFIGDAVMAVWGTPVAREDDAERAVRAALDLVSSVVAVGQDAGLSDVRARAGVMTGEAAVTLGAEGQGMVAGDLVNTASRIQSVATPGAVYVGEATRRLSEAAIAYVDVGFHELKGKAAPVALWRADRVVAAMRGLMRASSLEAPFVGRDREMRLVKELFHASSEEGRADLVSVMGIAGIGKSRLSWEFEKYVDGLVEGVWWHRGRCLAYGEGVAYRALVDMVRMRTEISDGEDTEVSLAKLRASLVELVRDSEERKWIEPRLAHLLGLEDRSAGDQAELFSAWRLFFERIAERGPTVLVFEDLQWADSALLDFIEYLLEWSKDCPLFILTLARPELQDRRPTWGAAARSFTSLYLEPLSAPAMSDLVRGLVPGLPAEITAKILDRAQGVPLYAVETVRMLLDRGVLTKHDGQFYVAGEIVDLEVPDTLHALIAARLDGLTREERQLLQDASVMGKTFSQTGLAAVSTVERSVLEVGLLSLVRKEILHVQADPRSPERGQYSFLQDLVKRVAYETLSKKERKARHLAVATYLNTASGYDEEEVVEVVASHYLSAYESDADAVDAEEIKSKARIMLAAAGEHAAGLAASEDAQRYFEQAASLAEAPIVQAELLERAGIMARTSGHSGPSADLFSRSIALFEHAGQSHPAARVSARYAEVVWDQGRHGDAVERMRHAFQVLSCEERDENLASVAAQFGRLLFFSGESQEAWQPLETALEISEAFVLPETFSQALNTKGLVLLAQGRPKEALALLKHALDVALESDASGAALRAYINVCDALARSDRHHEAVEMLGEGLALARKLGHRYWEWNFLGQMYALYATGEWDQVLASAAAIPEHLLEDNLQMFENYLITRPLILIHRGDVPEAVRGAGLFPDASRSADVQQRQSHMFSTALLLRANGRPGEAFSKALEAVEFGKTTLGWAAEGVKESVVLALEIAMDLGEIEQARTLLAELDALPAGLIPPSLHAAKLRFHGRIGALLGHTEAAESGFKAAAALYRELVTPFAMAVTLLEHGEWLVSVGRDSEAKPMLAESHDIFRQLDALPWLARLDKTAPDIRSAATP